MRIFLPGVLAGMVCLPLSTPATRAADLELVSRAAFAATIDSDGDSDSAFSVSRDGRYALFHSAASNLVAGDTNGRNDLFIHDHVSGIIERVNVSTLGAQANDESAPLASLSDDGRYVVFESRATNLVADASSGAPQVYLRDRQAGTTTLVSRTQDGRPSPGGGSLPQISADGRYIVFLSDDSLLPGDRNFHSDVYRADRSNGKLELVSANSQGEAGDWPSGRPKISADGRFVVFYSDARNLLPNWPLPGNLLLRDMDSDSFEALNRAADGNLVIEFHDVPTGNAFSADGRYVLFNTHAALVPDDTNDAFDGYRYDRSTGTVLRTTQNTTSGLFADRAVALSDDGKIVLLDSVNELVAGVGAGKLRNYLRDLGSGQVSLVKLRPGVFDPADQVASCDMAGDAKTVYCVSPDEDLAPRDHNGFNDLFYSVVGSDTGERVTKPYSTAAVAGADNHSRPGAISADGRYVVFSSLAGNLVPGDNNGVADVFLRDRMSGTTTRISVGAGATESACASEAPQITPDGFSVLFQSCGALLPSANGKVQIYRYERDSQRLQLISRNADGAPCAADCRLLDASADGRSVVFLSRAGNLVADALPADGGLFLRDVDSGAPVLVNRPPQGGTADCHVSDARLSGDAQKVFFSDCSGNLVAGDSNFSDDVFLYRRAGASLERVSLDSKGQQLPFGARLHGVSQDGSLVLFSTSDLCERWRGFQLRDLATGQSECVSDGALVDIGSWADISADGKRIAFTAQDPSNAYIGQTENVFVYDRASQQVRRITAADSSGSSERVKLCPGGDCVLFGSRAANLVVDDANGGFGDVFLATDPFDDAIFRDGFQARP
ncbi:hypothetical protein ACFJIW_24110 [Tahibacter sp. UC22_41]|uniref:hypothetical protein n=1 Tax=Tahibacter sp. UC22_41 TaxID=3350178 RepID=UPI0036DCC74D